MNLRIVLLLVLLFNLGCTPLVGAMLKKQQDASIDTPVEGTPYCERTDQCPVGNYCRIEPCGAMVGFCTTIPATCPPEDAPVCGCNGLDYPNFCELTQAQQARDHDGPCNTAVCGRDNQDACGAGFFCDGPCDWSASRCVPVEESCYGTEPVDQRVCGCDDMPFDSDCLRIQAGVRLKHPGPCDALVCFEGDTVTCGAESFCEGVPGMCDTGSSGWCMPLPGSCELIYDPVCGCDDITYESDCIRQTAGVWQKNWGRCTSSTICDVDLSRGDPQGTCDPGYFCEIPPGVCLAEPSGGMLRGQCVDPMNCGDPLLPCGGSDVPSICGCDGTEYGDDCTRRNASMNVGCCAACDSEDCTVFTL